MDSYQLTEDVKHLGGKKKGDIVTCEGEPRGQLGALVYFKQAVKVDAPKAKPKADPAPAKETPKKG